MRAKLTPKGFEAYLEALVKQAKDVDAVAERALTAGGEILVAGMKQRAPKDTHNLEEHIQMAGPFRDGNKTYAYVGLPRDSSLVDAETARYGTAQEYGSVTMAAHPYIRPTLDEDMRKARAAMVKIFKAEMGIE